MFVLGLDDSAYDEAVKNKDYALLNKHLYRVQKMTKGDYFFRYHLETLLDDSSASKQMKKFLRCGIKSFISQNPHKVQVSVLGKLIIK